MLNRLRLLPLHQQRNNIKSILKIKPSVEGGFLCKYSFIYVIIIRVIKKGFIMSRQLRRLCGHIVAGFIPNKYTAHRVKNLIEYGILNKIKENKKLQSKERKGKFKYNLAIVAIMKNEGPYLKEWIEFHKLVGVQKFYLYDNDSNDDTRQILDEYIKDGTVDYTFFPGQKMQLPAYNDCIEKHKNETKWLAVIDLDEYIVPTKEDSILPLLNEQNDKVAQIIIPRLVFSMGCHEHNVAGRTVSMLKSKIRIHHYHCKSWQEYKQKAARGDAWDGMDAGQKKYQRECFNRHDLNDIVDTTALRFVEKLKGK